MRKASLSELWKNSESGVIREEKVVIVSTEASTPFLRIEKDEPLVIVNQNMEDSIRQPDLITEGKWSYLGERRTAIVIVAYNRPKYLNQTLNSLLDALVHSKNKVKVDIVLSQDGYLKTLDTAVHEFKQRLQKELPKFSFVHIHHDQESRPGDSGYHKLARHFGWFLKQVFDIMQYEQVIILEDDLEISSDFFSYFDQTSYLLWKDPTLFCVSAWNDNGQIEHVRDNKRLFRSDFFPGLGWMMTSTLWKEIGEKWPEAYWDDWLRHPNQRRGRSCIRPEVSRSYTFGVVGTSNSQFYGAFLKNIKKNDEYIDFSSMDLSYLMKAKYDAMWLKEIEASRVVTVFDIPEHSDQSVRIAYDHMKKGRFAFKRIAQLLHIMEDEKAGVYRTAYMGVISVIYHGTQVYLVPEIGPTFLYDSS